MRSAEQPSVPPAQELLKGHSLRTDSWSQDGAASLTHRYFPEWADLPWREGSAEESDRNSYSAGGYAEEFGHSSPPPPATSEGDSEGGTQWLLLIGCLHPGYPERAKPLALEGPAAEDGIRPREYPVPAGQESPFKVIRVEPRKARSGLTRVWKALYLHLRAP